MTQPFVRPDVEAFLQAQAVSGTPSLHELPVAIAREAFGAISAMTDAPAIDIAAVRDLWCDGPGGPIPLRLYDCQRDRSRAGPLIVFFHGGGFVLGGLESHDSFCRFLADCTDLPVLAVDYRLAPEHPFPGFVDDAECVARWVAGQPAALGLEITGLVTCGDSAGGHLAICVAQQLAARPAGLPLLAQWVFYPFVGGGNDWDSVRNFSEGYVVTRPMMDWFDGHCGTPYDDPRYALLLGPVPAVPLMIQTTSLDPLQDQGIAYARLAEAHGARVVHLEAAGMVHGFVTMRGALPSTFGDLEDAIAAGLSLLDMPQARDRP
ncbi:alpha/beta hydrolase [Blastomonas sp. AAP53]|uniref:alpha/beta hydrolase n=1 Tax=Blastomonas sp. AAP53 TaxID=1248760 RepID=UPI0002F8D314|nr:alpha/beta hydrolase [Blastomonas sp. AAP53]